MEPEEQVPDDTTNQARQQPTSYKDFVLGMKALGIPLAGWKHGRCSYCANTNWDRGQPVMVHKLPNRLKACMKCYKRPDNASAT
jgi:hypothetical protein